MPRWIVVLLILCTASVAAEPQVPRSHQAWSTEEGLPGSSVQQVFQSRDGYLWLATESGAARFDGYTFHVLRHDNQPAFVSDDVTAIAEDTHGVLWFGTSDGLVQSRGPVLRRFGTADGLPSGSIVSLAALPDGTLLVLTSAGLVRLDGSGFYRVEAAGGPVLSLERTQDGAVWFATAQGLESYVQASGHFVAKSPHSDPLPIGLEPPKGLQHGPGNTVWTWSSRSLRIVGPRFSRLLRIGHDLPGTRLTALLVDRAGYGWIGTNRGCFLLAFDVNAGVQSVDALRLETVLSFLEDGEGNLWIGTENSGLHVLRPRRFRSEPAAAGEAVTAGVTASDGSVWYGTREEGVRRIRGGVSDPGAPVSTLISPVVLSMAAGTHGDVWVGTPDGLDLVAGRRVTHYSSSVGLPDDFVRTVLVDSKGTVWAGTRRGLAHIAGTTVTTLTQADGLGSDSIGPMAEVNSAQKAQHGSLHAASLWIGTAAGLSRVEGSRVESFSPGNTPPSNVVTALAPAGGDALWVGLHGAGLSRFDGQRFSPVRNPTMPREISAVVVDGLGFVWMRGERGIYRAAAAQMKTCAEDNRLCAFTVDHFGAADGMPSNLPAATGTPGVWFGPGGELWFGTRKGIAVADPARLPFDTVPPPIVVERFLVDDRNLPVAAQHLDLPAGARRYVFDYVALSYTSPQGNRYRSMLEGLDRDWVDAGTARSVSYSSLPPRQYRFRVQAQNPDGVWSQQGAEVRFRVLAPFYKRWWFSTALVLAAAALVLFAFRLRLRSVQARFALISQERNRVAREIHDTLAQDLVSVSLQVEVASQLLKSGQSARAAAQLETTRAVVKEGLESARQSIWNLRTNTDDSLPARLTTLCNRLAQTESPPARLNIGGTFRRLPTAVEDAVFRIAQECLTNSYRHSGASAIAIQLRYNPDSLSLSVLDDGRGFSEAEAKQLEGHYGLRGMRERAEALHGTLTIRTGAGEGTETLLSVPLGEEKEARS